MDTQKVFREVFEKLQEGEPSGNLKEIREQAFRLFSEKGIPAARHEEWKYTRISALFNKDYALPPLATQLGAAELEEVRLPDGDAATELFFVNGIFAPSFSRNIAPSLVVMPLEEAVRSPFAGIVSRHLGHSSQYQKDGINALNTALVHGGVFIGLEAGKKAERPVYIYHITDARSINVFAQPRNLIHLAEGAQLQLVERHQTIGPADSFTNGVIEVVLEKGAYAECYKIQDDARHTSQVDTTHIRQAGESRVHVVTISLNGGIVRNNLNVVLEAPSSEAYLYGLYFLKGSTHVDNHTLVDHAVPHCYSNELYKGIVTDGATGVFNGKIWVRKDAQKTNAYQSNKNLLLSDNANVYTKPQLEIFADDVKCSHGCTIGRLDEEALFFLRARGIEEGKATALLVHAFALDVLEHIRLEPIRAFVDQIISEQLALKEA